MQRRFVRMTLAALWVAALGTLVPAGPAAAADRRSGQTADSPYSMPGTSGSSSTSGQANYQADYHADYSMKGTSGPTQDPTRPRQERRDDSRDSQRDSRNIPPGTDRYGRGPYGWSR
jgi:hypothetical protein